MPGLSINEPWTADRAGAVEQLEDLPGFIPELKLSCSAFTGMCGALLALIAETLRWWGSVFWKISVRIKTHLIPPSRGSSVWISKIEQEKSQHGHGRPRDRPHAARTSELEEVECYFGEVLAAVEQSAADCKSESRTHLIQKLQQLYTQVLLSTGKGTALYSTLLYSTLFYSTLLYSILLYSTLLYSTLLYSTLFYSTLLYSTLLYSTLLYSTLFYSILLTVCKQLGLRGTDTCTTPRELSNRAEYGEAHRGEHSKHCSSRNGPALEATCGTPRLRISRTHT
ncbi:hypothetical protein NFI96_004862 [Prochilodus magdalenae]|nr:hypothetical protein NFI96_004862 [Prochilodus magdalenae]